MNLGTLSELQWTLLGAGGAIVAAVWAYNKWQEVRLRRQAARVFRGEHADLLLDTAAGQTSQSTNDHNDERNDERIEPVFATEAQDVGEEPDAGDVGEESVMLLPPLDLADRAIDCQVRLEAAKPVAAPAFWAAQQQLLGSLEGRLRWIGYQGGQWKQLNAHDAASYRRLIAVLQLADRSGPLGEVELSKFFFGVGQLAEDFPATIELPDAADVLDRAHRLDDFCASVDWRIGVNVVSRTGQPFAASRLLSLAAAAGLRCHDDDLYHAENESGQTLFTLGNLGGLPLPEEALEIAGVTLTIDVPLVTDGVAAFDRLLSFARQLMAAEDGLLVDDQRAPLNEATLAAIRAKIIEFQQKMAGQDIPSGGRRAMRLYS